MTGAAVSATSIAPHNDADALPDVSVDVIKALSLAYKQPDSTAARKVAERLRQRVDELLPAATGYVKALPKGSAPQESGEATLSVAAELRSTENERLPADDLRLLAKTVDILHRYASAAARHDAAR